MARKMEKTASMTHKKAAIDFLEHAARGDVQYAYGTHVAPGFRHHNPYFPGDADSLRAGMIDAHEKSPNRMFEVRRAIEEGDMVAVHSRVVKDHDQEIAVVHLFRFDDRDRVVELWDVAQEVPRSSPNRHGMF
jgi:predicted SnoaL-like aldol condensation-catalyzing enzyme